ncbi:hypothetical protein CA606_20120 [Caulobacter vibrioides]|uniref:Uncharacterized protein n=1 Tax=Caulobacter vibrioides TaxID=155892 RepID=A0A2S1B7S1_CAUVI|nr:hypothetical protein CA606_20120 [Caulobacter vibrioides]
MAGRRPARAPRARRTRRTPPRPCPRHRGRGPPGAAGGRRSWRRRSPGRSGRPADSPCTRWAARAGRAGPR